MIISEFRAMFPEITVTDYADSYVQIWLDFANENVSADRFGGINASAYKIAVGNLAAHLTVVDDNAMTTTQSVGSMSVTYSSGEDTSVYNLTAYGRTYTRLCRLFGVGGTVV